MVARTIHLLNTQGLYLDAVEVSSFDEHLKRVN
jgi:hypothetical protein